MNYSQKHKPINPDEDIVEITENYSHKVNTIADIRLLINPPDRVWVSGYYEKGDGAFGSNIFEWDSTSVKDDNGGTVIKLDGVVTGRYLLRYSGAVNVKWFGAVGDGVTDDTSSFIALEVSVTSEKINLLGNIYLVTVIPTNNDYYNGSFKVGTVYTKMKDEAVDHPMKGDVSLVLGGGRQHWWGMSLFYRPENNILYMMAVPASKHASSYGSPLQLFTSVDRGQTFDGGKTIYTSERVVSDVVAGNMSNVVIGALLQTRDEATDTPRNDYIQSTDFGTTWTLTEDVLSGSSPIFPYGDLIEDGTDRYVFGYGGNEIRYAKTVDAGLNWTTGVAVPFDGTNWQAEASVVKVDTNKYFMFIRRENTTLAISKATSLDGIWSTPIDTGIDLDSNPVYARVEGGRVYVYMYSRSFGGDILDEENTVQLIDTNASDLYDSMLLLPNVRTVGTLPSRAIGYPILVKIGNEFVWTVNTGETDVSTNDTSNSMVLIGKSDGVVNSSFSYANQGLQSANMIDNATFNHWTRASSFVGITSNTNVADRWYIITSGTTATITKTELTPKKSRLFPHNPAYGMGISATADDYIGLAQRHKGKDSVLSIMNNVITATVWGYGEIPSRVSSTVNVNFGTGGSASGSSTTNATVTSSANSVWCVTTTIPAIVSSAPTIADDCYIDFIINSSLVSAWDCVITGVQFEKSPNFSIIETIPPNEERSKLDRFVQSKKYLGSQEIGTCAALTPTLGSTHINTCEMTATPTVTILNGNSLDFEVYPAGQFGTDTNFAGESKNGFSIRTTVPDIISGRAYVLRCKADSEIDILIDAE